MDFVAIDVETANADLASICQIGLVGFQDGVVKQSWKTLVNPEDDFDGINVSIHGIDERTVKGAPTFPKIFHVVKENLTGIIVASHTSFDRVAMARVLEKYDLDQVECTWLDTAKVVRRAWPELSQKGYGLCKVANKLGIKFVHHDAEEDARAAGEILVRAIQKTVMTVNEWLDRVNRPINPLIMKGDPEGPLFGEVVAFTGSLSIPRGEAAQRAATAGCEVAPSVTRSTTLLVVGDQDIRKLAGQEKSSKHRKAEELIGHGQPIRILKESDFRRMVNWPSEECRKR